MQWLRHTSGGIVTTECVRENKRKRRKCAVTIAIDSVSYPARARARDWWNKFGRGVALRPRCGHCDEGQSLSRDQRGTTREPSTESNLFPTSREGPRHPAPQ